MTRPSLARKLRLFAVALCLLPWLLWLLPLGWSLRFGWDGMNYLAIVAAGLLLPSLLIPEVDRIRQRLLRFTAWLLLLLGALVGGVFAVLVSMFILPMSPSDVNRLSSLERDGYRVALYRNDCGATCGYSLVLHQEWDWPLGLVRYRPVWDRQGVAQADLRFEQGIPTLRQPDGSLLWQGVAQPSGKLSKP